MSLKIIRGNVLDAKADAIIFTIDGAAKGMEGAVSRQFARRWPEVWSEVEDEIRYPVPLGNVFEHEPVAQSSFRVIILAATLHHKDDLNEQAKKGVVKTALETAIKTAAGYGATTIATTIMKGGWRLKEEAAFMAMSAACESAFRKHPNIELLVYVPDELLFEKMKGLAHSLGWRG